MQPGCLARDWGEGRKQDIFLLPFATYRMSTRTKEVCQCSGTKNVCRRDHPLLAYKAPAQARRSSQSLEPPALLIHSHKFLVRPPSPRLGAEAITVGSSVHTMLPWHSSCLPCIPRACRAFLVPTVAFSCLRHGNHVCGRLQIMSKKGKRKRGKREVFLIWL